MSADDSTERGERKDSSARNESVRDSYSIFTFDEENERPSNEYVLNVAFFSFLGFMIVQSFFALIAKSQSMLADSLAMGVDAMTYLLNMLAERVKNRPYSEKEKQLPSAVRKRNRSLIRCYMELTAPLVSVVTLILVTISVIQEAMTTLNHDEIRVESPNSDDEPSVGIMLFFSGLNLLLDVVNVTCFARARSLSEIHPKDFLSIRVGQSSRDIKIKASSTVHESSLLLSGNGGTSSSLSRQSSNNVEMSNIEEASYQKERSRIVDVDSDYDEEGEMNEPINMNMCSALTHVCADTMRSIAVLVAAGIAYLFEAVDPGDADAVAALLVSVIILVSLVPLLQGLFATASEILTLWREKPAL